MATLLIERTNEYSNRFRKIGVYVDSVKVGEISNGETKKFDVSAGRHSITCKIDWCSSPTVLVDLSGDEIKGLKGGGFKHANWILSTGLIAVLLLPLLKRRVPEFKFLYYLIIPIGGLLIYYITVGRKKYLSLMEKQHPA